jgi:hypothetical protein
VEGIVGFGHRVDVEGTSPRHERSPPVGPEGKMPDFRAVHVLATKSAANRVRGSSGRLDVASAPYHLPGRCLGGR